MSAPVTLVDIINRFIESDKVSLPVFSSASHRIQQELAKKQPSIQVIEKIITAEQSLSSEVLKIANSPFYRGLAEVSTVRAAIMRLGTEEIQKVVLMAASRQHFKSSDKAINLMMKRLWQHAVGCAYGTVWLSKRYSYGVDQSQAFFGGLLHDVGKLLVLVIIEQVKRRNKTLNITEPLLLEAMARLHAREGAKLLAQWNMPEDYCILARDHHNQELDEKNIPLILVRMANLACHKLGIGLKQDTSLILPATLEARLLNLSEIDLAELEISLENTAVLRN